MGNDLNSLRIDRSEERERSSRWGVKVFFLLIVLTLVATGYFLYTGPLRPAKEVKVTSVIASHPSRAHSILTASGYVVAQRKADVASKATGRLEELLVEEGSLVQKGQVIGRLESRDVEAALSQAQADLQVSIASLQEAESDHSRKKSLVDSGVVSAWDYDLAEAKYKRALATVEASRARVRAAKVDVENTYIRAPFDGTVLTKSADVGEIVAPFGSAGNSKGAVVSMADMESLQVEADVSESNLERVAVEQPCEITLDAFPEKRYRGVVHMIVPTADRAKATVQTKVRFIDKDQRVLPEMSAKVTFLSEEITEEQVQEKPKILIDPKAVVERSGKKVVFIVKNGFLDETPVTTAGAVGNLLEIIQGVSPGDEAVVAPDASLKAGLKVSVVR